MTTMTSLFDELKFQKAGELLDILNEGLKTKDQYQPIGYFEEQEFTVFVASNREKDLMMNVVNFEGNIPEGFCVNWRIPKLILHDLGQDEFTR